MTSLDQAKKWNAHNNEVNPRDPRMAVVWIEPLLEWTRARIGAGSRVLDYGCGFFDLGARLSGERVDGFDIDANALEHARKTYGLREGVNRLFSARAEIPADEYDWVVVNSVVQYLAGESDLADLLVFLRSRLKAGGRVVLSDVIPPGYVAALDAVDNLVYAVRKGIAGAMLRHLWRCARAGEEYVLYRVEPSLLLRLAVQAGFEAQILPVNLTPSKRRYSVVLTRV